MLGFLATLGSWAANHRGAMPLAPSMNYSPHQLAYFAYQLTRRAAADSMDSMAGALLDAQVDLNPHQIDAALFATSNPLSKGVILADEVGLGKNH